MRYTGIITLWDPVLGNVIKGSFIHSFIYSFIFLFSGHEPLYFTENEEKTLRVSYDRDTHTIEYMN